MIRTYYLATEIIDGVEAVKGSQYIHHAILYVEGKLRKLVQDTIDNEHNGLAAIAESWREATKDEVTQFNEMKVNIPSTPPRDIYKELEAIEANLDLSGTQKEAFKVSSLYGMTQSQLETYIDNNVTHLVAAKEFLKKLSAVILWLVKQTKLDQ